MSHYVGMCRCIWALKWLMGQWSKIAEAAIDKHTVNGSSVRVAVICNGQVQCRQRGQRVNSLRLHQWPVFAHFDTGHIVGNTQTG